MISSKDKLNRVWRTPRKWGAKWIKSKEDAHGSKWTVLGRYEGLILEFSSVWPPISIPLRSMTVQIGNDGPISHGNDRHVWLRTDRFRPTVHLYCMSLDCPVRKLNSLRNWSFSFFKTAILAYPDSTTDSIGGPDIGRKMKLLKITDLNKLRIINAYNCFIMR